jgi:hypothetical protein
MEFTLIEDLVWCILWHYPLMLTTCGLKAKETTVLTEIAFTREAAN